MDVNSRRHHAFITSKKSWPPNIRHQDLKMLDVDWEEPVAKAIGADAENRQQDGIEIRKV